MTAEKSGSVDHDCPTCGRVLHLDNHSKVTGEIELRCFDLLFQGKTQTAIGLALGISTATVNALLHGKYPRSAALRVVAVPSIQIEAARAYLAQQASLRSSRRTAIYSKS